jgi:hypothetical protein
MESDLKGGRSNSLGKEKRQFGNEVQSPLYLSSILWADRLGASRPEPRCLDVWRPGGLEGLDVWRYWVLFALGSHPTCSTPSRLSRCVKNGPEHDFYIF